MNMHVFKPVHIMTFTVPPPTPRPFQSPIRVLVMTLSCYGALEIVGVSIIIRPW